MDYFLKVLLASDLPFLILFVGLAYIFMRQSWAREQAQRKIIYEQLQTVNSDIHKLAEIWKIIIEGELERRRKNE